MDIPILFEDKHIVVIDKPSGVVCNRSSTWSEMTLQDWWDSRYIEFKNELTQSETNDYFWERSGMVHRLDRETSGVMVMAKNYSSFENLLSQFRSRLVAKEYLALTHGFWPTLSGEINMSIGRRRDDRRKFGVREGGRESITEYEVKSQYGSWNFPKELKVDDRGYSGFSLVLFKPKTGRTHQIRVHARQVGHPIVGDSEYAGRKRSREDRKWAMRVLLHADKLSFQHPSNGKIIHFESKNNVFEKILKYFIELA